MGYFGSKATSGLCQPLIAMMPPHDTYIETHLGGGAIMRRKPAALHNIGIDRDARALGEFECDYPVELIHGCAHRFLGEYAFEGTELLYSDPPEVRLSLPANGARRISAQQLESGGAGVTGRFGDGAGKWQLSVTADGAIEVMSLLQSPTGHLSNLSTTPRGEVEIASFVIVADGATTARPLQTIQLAVPGGLGDSDYTVSMDLSGTGAFAEDDTIEVEGFTTDRDQILFASPLTYVLPEAKKSREFAVRVRRQADRQISNILRFSIEDVTIPSQLSGYPTTALVVVLKSIYTSNADPLLNADGLAIQLGTTVVAARTLGLDSAFSDVQAEVLLQSLFGVSAVDLAQTRRAESRVHLPGARHGDSERNFTSPFATEFRQYDAKMKCEGEGLGRLVRVACDALVDTLQCAFRAFENDDGGGYRCLC